MTRIVLSLAALLLAGCDRTPRPAASPQPAPPSVEARAPAPQRETPPVGYVALSNTAMSITGDLAMGPAWVFAQGQRYEVQGLAPVKAGDAAATAGANWTSLFNLPEDAEVQVFRVLSEAKGAARNGGLCGAEATSYLAVAERREPSSATMFLAAFKGPKPPGPEAADTDLCGTFTYAPKAAVVSETKK